MRNFRAVKLGFLLVGLSLPVLARAAPLKSLDDLINVVQTGDHGRPLQSIDDLLAWMAQTTPGAMGGYTLVYASRSLQSATTQFPRVIFHGSETRNYASKQRLILAFPGDPDRPDYQTLEVLSQDAETEQVSLTEIRFPGAASGSPEIEYNPPRCTVCHSQPAKPVWDTYPLWPGIYGSLNDTISPRNLPELEEARKFAVKVGSTGRYKHLSAGDRGFFDRGIPNLNMTVVLSQINFRRIVQNLRALPRWSSFKPMMLGASANCFETGADLNEWLPEDAAAALSPVLNSLQVATKAATIVNEEVKIPRFFHDLKVPVRPLQASEFDTDRAPISGALRFTTLLAGGTLQPWSMVLTPQPMSFSTGHFGIGDFQRVLSEALKDGPGLAPEGRALNCEQLAEASKAAISDALSRQLVSEVPALRAQIAADGGDSETVLLRCMRCHTDGPGPRYPLDRSPTLGRELGSKMLRTILLEDEASGRMPKAPLAPLAADEKAAFTDFLRNLGS